MRRPLFALLLAAAALLLAACASSTGPGWTYAPPTAAPSVDPSAAASAAPSGDASEAPSGAAGGVAISAIGIAFEQAEVSAPAGAPFTISFDNKEAVPHNVEIKDPSGASVFKGDIVTGPIVKEYAVPALAAGTYEFNCTVHPNMVGSLKVGG